MATNRNLAIMFFILKTGLFLYNLIVIYDIIINDK